MIGIVWTLMLGISIIYSFFSGNFREVMDGILQSCTECVSFIVKTGSFMIMWSGIINIAQKSSLSEKIAEFLSPLIRLIFKGIKKGSDEAFLIASNMSANMLGLSNAATPLGIEAMKKLSEKSRNKTATDNMCMLAVVNCASIQLIPSTLIAMRSAAGSSSPDDITVPIWITSALTLTFAVLITKIAEKRR